MITEEQYLEAKKIIVKYTKQQFVIGSKPKPKPKKQGESFFENWDRVIKNM